MISPANKSGSGRLSRSARLLSLQPEDVEVGFVAGDNLFVGVLPPAPFRGFGREALLAFVAVLGVVAFDKLLQVRCLQRALFQGVVHVGTVVVEPHFTCPGIFVGRHNVKKEDVGFHALCVKDAGWQPQNGVQFGGFEQLFSDKLSGAAFKEDVIGKHHGSLAVNFQDGVDMLQKVELLVGSDGLEILPVVDKALLLLLLIIVGEGHAALFAEGGIGEHVIVPDATIRKQRISR